MSSLKTSKLIAHLLLIAGQFCLNEKKSDFCNMIVALSAFNFPFKLLLMIFTAFLLHFLFTEQNNINVGLNLVYAIKGSFPISRTIYAELLEH